MIHFPRSRPTTIRKARRTRCGRYSPRAISLVEVMISTVVVSGMLVASLNVYGKSKMAETRALEKTQGLILAQELLAEIQDQAYDEPFATSAWGTESGEDNGNRKFFDDVDDYLDWSASPPQDRNGAEITDFDGWTRSVVVNRRDTDDMESESNVETGIKWITVIVQHGDREVVRLSMVKCVTSAF